MIKIIKATYINDHIIKLEFSDRRFAQMDFSYLLSKSTVLTEALKDIDYFQSFFLEFGALCWQNGLELSPSSLYQNAKSQGVLFDSGVAA